MSTLAASCILLLARGGDVAEQFEGARLRRVEGGCACSDILAARGVELARAADGRPLV